MKVYMSEWSSDLGAMIVHAVFNGTCTQFSSTDEYAIGSTCICTDGIMVKYAASTWTKYNG